MLSSPNTLLASVNYRRIWLIGLLTGVTRWLEFLALGVFAYEITQSPSLVALLALLRMAPFIFLGFFIGALTDVIDRKRWLIILTVLVLMISASMAVAAERGVATYGLVAVATFISGIYWVTDMPLRRRLLVDSVDHRLLTSATAFDNITNYVTRALGVLVGGIIYEWLSLAGVFALSALLYAICLLLALGIRQRQAALPREALPRPGWAKLLVPPRALIFDPAFLIVIGVTIVYNLWCFPLVAMVPVMAERDLQLSAVGVGMLSACEGIGGTLAAIVIGAMATNRSLFPLYYWGVFSYLILVALLALHLSFSTATLAFVCAGAAAACFSAAQYALVYLIAPPDMRGKATGILSIFIGTSAIGMYNAGYLFEHFATPNALWIMAGQGMTIMAFLGVVLWFATDRARVT
ncbi:MAG: MFS transporter [Hyphomicrobiaceae bacterium]